MKRATPVQMRKMIEVANVLAKAGILFVPVPILGDKDYEQAIKEMDKRLEILAAHTETII